MAIIQYSPPLGLEEEVIHFEAEEALLGTPKYPSQTLIMMEELGNLEPEEEVAESFEAKEEEEGSITVWSRMPSRTEGKTSRKKKKMPRNMLKVITSRGIMKRRQQ